MSFISKLFKRKPGGTVIGNLFRGIANTASGGILGNGQMMISQQDADKRDLSEVDYQKKYGQSKDGVPVQPPTQTTDPNTGQLIPTAPKVPFSEKVKDFFKKPMVRLAFAAITVIGLIILIVRYVRKRKGGAKRKGGY